ncbi:Crp/Fnr family transcriptional regulator [Micromonospora sp. NPDC049044]|uniref:Crp/Fnr family transcriptional regulator n=1 Tax=unclassified Micromonospora TaxID=2617518 RepID=UPI0033C9BDCC
MDESIDAGRDTLLERLPRQTGRKLLAIGQRRTYADGDYLIRHDDDGDFAVILSSAQVKVVTVTSTGRSCLLGIRRAGDVVGEMALLDAKPRSASVIADGPTSGYVIPGPRFVRLLDREPVAAREVARTVVDRLRHADARRVDFTYPVPVRVIRLLSEQVARAGDARREVTVRLTQREIAELVGAAEVSVQKVIRDLVAAGLITTGYGVLTVPSPELWVTEAHRLAQTRHRM